MPQYNVTSPTGQTFTVTAPEGASQAQVLAYAKAQFAKTSQGGSSPVQSAGPSLSPSTQPSADKASGFLANLYGGFLEPAAAMASSAIAKPVSDLAGLAGIVGDATGIAPNDPGQTKASIQNALTYQPRTSAGQQATNILSLPGQGIHYLASKVGQGGQSLSDALGAPQQVGQAVNNGLTEAGDQAGGILLAKGVAKLADLPSAPKVSEPTATTLQNARSAKLLVTPEYAQNTSGPIAKAASMGGSEVKMQQAMSKYNTGQRAPEMVKEQLGIPADTPLTQPAIDAVAQKANGAYTAVQKQPPVALDQTVQDSLDKINTHGDTNLQGVLAKYKPQLQTDELLNTSTQQIPTAQIVQDVRDLRANARASFKATDDPNALRQANANWQTAQTLDQFLDRQLRARGQGNLADAYTQSRQTLAQIHSVQDAFNPDTGSIDPKSLARDLDNGVPLSGNLETLARTYRAFPKVMQAPERLPSTGIGSGAIDTFLAGKGLLSGNIPEAVAGIARPLARARVQTQGYQNQMVNPQPSTVRPAAATGLGLLIPSMQSGGQQLQKGQ